MGRCLALKYLKWGCWNPTSGKAAPSNAFVQLQAPRRYSSNQQNVNIPSDLRVPPSSHSTLSKGGPSYSCACACFTYPCNVLKALVEVRLYSSGVFCLGQYFQQLIIRKEVEPTNTERDEERLCLVQQQGLSPDDGEQLKTLFLSAHCSLCICVHEQPPSSHLPSSCRQTSPSAEVSHFQAKRV